MFLFSTFYFSLPLFEKKTLFKKEDCYFLRFPLFKKERRKQKTKGKREKAKSEKQKIKTREMGGDGDGGGGGG